MIHKSKQRRKKQSASYGCFFVLSSVDKNGIFFISGIVFFFGIIRIDHKLLYVGISAVYRDERAKRNSDYERQDHTERHEESENVEIDKHSEKYAEKCDKIAFKAEKRENKRVFEYFVYGKIKRYHKGIDVKTHKEIDNEQENAEVEHYVVDKSLCVSTPKIENVERNKGCNNVNNSHGQSLFPVCRDGTEKVGSEENGIFACVSAKNSRHTAVCNTKSENNKKCYAKENYRCVRRK